MGKLELADARARAPVPVDMLGLTAHIVAAFSRPLLQGNQTPSWGT